MRVCGQSRGQIGHEKSALGLHRVMVSADGTLYTPQSVYVVSSPASSGRSNHSPVIGAFSQHCCTFHPDYSRLVDVYRPFAAPTRLHMETEGQASIVSMRQCCYSDSTTSTVQSSTENQQDANDLHLRQPQSRNQYLPMRP